MQKHRIISLLSILIMVIIPVIGWFLIAQPQLNAATLADQQRADAAASIAATQAIVAQLEADSANLPVLNEELDELRTSIPAGVDPSGYLDGLSALAKVSKVQITELSVSDPIAYVSATAPVDPNAVAAPADGETPVEGEAVVEAAPFPGIVVNPLVDSSNFVAIPVTIEVMGKSSTILRFVNGLQSNSRLFLVNTLTTEPGADDSTLVGKIGGFIYAIPTGAPGDPRPVSTIVKSMDPPSDDSDEEEADADAETDADADSESESDTPDPDPTETSEP